jgi:hypothetical protein
MELEVSRQIFEKYPNIKFHENPSRVSLVVLCGQPDGRTDMTMLLVAFRSFAYAPNNAQSTNVMLYGSYTISGPVSVVPRVMSRSGIEVSDDLYIEGVCVLR